MLRAKSAKDVGGSPHATPRLCAWLQREPRFLRGLSWRLVALTAIVGLALGVASDPLLEHGWAAGVHFGIPAGIASWLAASWPWFALLVVAGLLILLFAYVLLNMRGVRIGAKASLALAVIGATALSWMIFIAGTGGYRSDSYLWREFGIALLSWSLAAATWYAVERARLITWKGLALLFLFALVNYVRGIAKVTDSTDEVAFSTIAAALTYVAGALPIVVGVVAAVNRFPSAGRKQYAALALAVVLGTVVGRSLLFGIETGGSFIDMGGGVGRQHPVVYTLHVFQAGLLRFGVLGALFAAGYAYYRNEASAATDLQKAELEQARLDAQMDEARLQVLQAQIEPHFLFNTLAHVKRLYKTDSRAARAMLDNLMRYLAVALPQMRAADSTVEREAALAKAYLDIYRIRMGRRLAFEISVPESLREARLPPMMLLTLVENAVKHGVSPLAEGGIIRIDATLQSGLLELNVADTGRGFVAPSGAGTGLANVRARLTALYGNSGQLSLHANSPRGVTASIALPLALGAPPTGA